MRAGDHVPGGHVGRAQRWVDLEGRLLLLYGRAYDPVTDTWHDFPQAGGRRDHRQFASTVMAGDEYVVWGGAASGETYVPLDDGIAFLPEVDWR